MSPADQILYFWFGVAGTPEATYAQRCKLWFQKRDETDQEIRARFLSFYQQAVAGEFAHWEAEPTSCLALMLLLDQFPRNLFRGTPQAFASDPQALAVANRAIDRQFDQALPPIQRLFIYLPFEHSEAMPDQQRSVSLFRELVNANPELLDVFDYANRHLAVIKRFGRFPHRNVILGRTSTLQEVEFLKQPGSSF
jgi:uncharacterized protein (DUF924 family)